MAILLEESLCIKTCRKCEFICPGQVIDMVDYYPRFRLDTCWYCGACEVDCPTNALKVIPPAAEEAPKKWGGFHHSFGA